MLALLCSAVAYWLGSASNVAPSPVVSAAAPARVAADIPDIVESEAPLAVGARVQALSAQGWQPGSIVELNAGLARVRYDNTDLGEESLDQRLLQPLPARAGGSATSSSVLDQNRPNPLPPLPPEALTQRRDDATLTCAAANPDYEYATNRFGGDYQRAPLRAACPELCAAACEADSRCQAWSLELPSTTGYACWLKDSQPAPTANDCCVSGTVTRRVDRAEPPIILSGAEPIGCFKDTNAFDLDGHLERSASNTPQGCIAKCSSLGFAFAGVQYGESCLCGDSYGRYGTANNCDYACTGDARQICGGFAANTVYATGIKGSPKP